MKLLDTSVTGWTSVEENISKSWGTWFYQFFKAKCYQLFKCLRQTWELTEKIVLKSVTKSKKFFQVSKN